MEIRKDILMKDIEIRELFRNREEYAGKEIVVRGWVRGNRASNQFGFISLNDGTFFTPLQVVYEASKIDNYEEISKVHLAAGVMVKGVLELTPGAQQPFELKRLLLRLIRYRIIRCKRSVIPWSTLEKSHIFVLEATLSLRYLECAASLLMRFISSFKSVITYMYTLQS